MREMLFRGKRLDNGEWVEGNLFAPDEVNHRKAPTEILVGTNIVRISWEVDPATVGQYTGLKDKNGRRIFEGDIVKCKGEGRICKVGYYTSPAYCGYDLYAVGNLKALPPHSWEFLDGLKVIGNIHDNPELMEEQ